MFGYGGVLPPLKPSFISKIQKPYFLVVVSIVTISTYLRLMTSSRRAFLRHSQPTDNKKIWHQITLNVSLPILKLFFAVLFGQYILVISKFAEDCLVFSVLLAVFELAVNFKLRSNLKLLKRRFYGYASIKTSLLFCAFCISVVQNLFVQLPSSSGNFPP